MREIKFRAWINNPSKWADGCMVNGEGGFVAYYNGMAYYSAELEQFTGLRDKNGREIYEGDILKTENYFGIGTGVVRSGSWGFYIDEIIVSSELVWGTPDGDHWQTEQTAVIGNIHENPELLA